MLTALFAAVAFALFMASAAIGFATAYALVENVITKDIFHG